MRKLVVLLIALTFPAITAGQVLVYEFVMDTNTYEWNNAASAASITQDPFSSNFGNLLISFSQTVGWITSPHPGMAYRVLKKKNSNQYDIFSGIGKIGSISIPQSLYHSSNYQLQSLCVSQTFVDADLGWEYIAGFQDTGYSSPTYPDTPYVSLVDDNNTVLLSQKGYGFSFAFGNDAQNTYCYLFQNGQIAKTWRLRTGISLTQPLAKSAVSASPATIFMPPSSSSMRVSLSPSSSGTSIEMFDMLGKLVFSKNMSAIKSPTTFTIPTSGLPRSPIISKIENSNGRFIEKILPIK